ncbi:Retrovirus-related polyprotein from transposon [Salix suchowensis]|nr:Retrovirus-related polyprotein from transposon [Salix suchowensis]
MTSLSLNVGNFVTLKLTQSNYPLWREQVLGLAESQDLVEHLTRETTIPTKYSIPTENNTGTETNTPQLTQEFITWQKSDRLLRGWIIGTLSEEALGLVIGLDTALTTIRDHIQTFKSLCDNLAGIGKPLPDKEKVFCLPTSLGPQYETFTTTMLKLLNFGRKIKILIKNTYCSNLYGQTRSTAQKQVL